MPPSPPPGREGKRLTWRGKQSHSVAQSSFDKPCQPLQGGDVPAFWSGMMPVTAESTTMPIFTIMVNDTKPIWFYCATGRHCQNGMAGVINPYVPAQDRSKGAGLTGAIDRWGKR